ncbi:alpha/beta fold hydrolase [Stenotrophomonas sp. PS02289]|uniref:alpha/beta hydrolase n=1 Tax=Stenotrophomonas sp. PS02289 TaxID=2991422 RepID=UPI00249C563B|nr:alpha/beta fold hydrolase [Stenotrophomonas sp. PS02289]
MSKRWSCPTVFSAALLALTMFATPALAASTVDAEDTAWQLLMHLNAEEISEAEAMFTPEMAKAVPAATLKSVWSSLGGLHSHQRGRVLERQGLQIVLMRAKFGAGEFTMQVAVDAQGKVAGLQFLPVPPDPPAPVPGSANYRESEVQIETGKGALPGTLAMPLGKGPFRAVVLVHGSGPHDRNETVGPNRPFLDVARGLAAQGIAVLRYDKRTLVRPQDFTGEFSVDDETTDDAVAAVALLAGTEGVDPQYVYAMGHSQGGMLAPRIATRSGKVAGVILWSAPARSLLTLLPEQHRYLYGLDGTISTEEQAALDRLDAQIAAARGTAPLPASEMPLGLPASYWRGFEQIDPVADARALKIPILMLHGGRDFQVTETDWKLWGHALAGRATLSSSSRLNHLGIARDLPSSLEEYQLPGHVSPDMIEGVAAWIRQQP